MSREARLKFIDRKIKQNGKVTIKESAEYHQVSIRTIKRDIEYLRFSLNAPLEYSREKGGYYYTDEFRLFNFAGEKLLIFYALLKKIIKKNNFLPTSSEEIMSLLEEKMEKNYLKISERIIYNFSETEPVDLEDFKDIITSIEQQKRVKITYTSGKGKESKREVEAELIVNYNGSWYLIAFCHKAQDLRTFAFSRIADYEVTDLTNSKIFTKEELNNFFNESFGIYLGNKKENVEILFYEPAMYTVKKQIWHQDQKITKGENKKGKYLKFTIPAANFEEIIAKTLAYSPFAEIISPDLVREKWLEIIRKNYKRYIA